MGYYCTVPQCTSLAGKTKNVKFHRFPRDLTMADKWNTILKRGKPYTKYSKVCSLHFTQADYNVTTMGQWKTLSKDAVPSQNLPKLNPDGTVMVIRKSRTLKYKEARKEECIDKSEKWSHSVATPLAVAPDSTINGELHDSNMAYRMQSINTMPSDMSPQQQHVTHSQQTQIQQMRPKKQDAFMQTDPVQSEEDDSQTYTEPDKPYPELEFTYIKKYEMPKDYTKNTEDYIPQTNEEYNKEAEKYALERKSLNGYEKVEYQKVDGYKMDMYGYDKQEYRSDFLYQFTDSAEMLRNQQHNLQILQEQHRINENQNFFNENHIKQEMDLQDDDKFMYDGSKEQIVSESTPVYEDPRSAVEEPGLMDQLHVKQEPEPSGACESVLQPQGSPFYASNHNNVAVSGYYESSPRPGPELLIAKQNALAAQTQLWQNTMKRPFFYSDSPHYTTPPLLHRYDDIPRVLQ